MEDFERILNAYLDEEKMKEKLEQDMIEEDNNKKSIKTKGNDFAKTISISDFVSHYLGTVHDCTNLKHQGLKSFKNPYVVGVSNNFALKNPDCVIRDEILVVIDSYGNPGSYINPNLLKNIETMEEYKCLLKLFNQINIHGFENLTNYILFYKKLLLHINELEKTYIDSCDLLKTLSKEHLLKDMRKYVKQLHGTSEELREEILEIDNIIEFELNTLDFKEKKKTKQKKKSK